MRDSFLHYKAGEFAAEESFIKWVLAPDSEMGKEWANWLKLHPEVEEEIGQAREMVSTFTKQKSISIPTNPQNLWERIATSIEDDPVIVPLTPKKSWADGRSSRTWYNVGLVAAASIAILLILRIMTPGTIQLESPRGEHLAHTLPDNSQVELNAESSINYDKKGWADNRLVKLEGEAFFQVEKGSRFVVETPLGEVEVLGTSFNVYNRGENFRVNCMTGSVQVSSSKGGINEVLKPGEYVYWSEANGFQSSAFDKEDQETWWNGTYQFKDIPLAEVFEELGRQYDKEILVNPVIGKIKWNGSFKGNDLEKALEDISWTNNLTYKEQDGVIHISKKSVN